MSSEYIFIRNQLYASVFFQHKIDPNWHSTVMTLIEIRVDVVNLATLYTHFDIAASGSIAM